MVSIRYGIYVNKRISRYKPDGLTTSTTIYIKVINWYTRYLISEANRDKELDLESSLVINLTFWFERARPAKGAGNYVTSPRFNDPITTFNILYEWMQAAWRVTFLFANTCRRDVRCALLSHVSRCAVTARRRDAVATVSFRFYELGMLWYSWRRSTFHHRKMFRNEIV